MDKRRFVTAYDSRTGDLVGGRDVTGFTDDQVLSTKTNLPSVLEKAGFHGMLQINDSWLDELTHDEREMIDIGDGYKARRHTGANSYQGGVIATRSQLTEYMRHNGLKYNEQCSDTERGWAEGIWDASLMLIDPKWHQHETVKLDAKDQPYREPIMPNVAELFPIDMRSLSEQENMIRDNFERVTGQDLHRLINAFVGQRVEQTEQPKVPA